MSVCLHRAPSKAPGFLLGLNQTQIMVNNMDKRHSVNSYCLLLVSVHTQVCGGVCPAWCSSLLFCPLKQKIIWPEPSTVRSGILNLGRSPCQEVPGAQRQDCVCKAPLAGFPALVSAEPLDNASCPAHYSGHVSKTRKMGCEAVP